MKAPPHPLSHCALGDVKALSRFAVSRRACSLPCAMSVAVTRLGRRQTTLSIFGG
jgi:hypothetical protein